MLGLTTTLDQPAGIDIPNAITRPRLGARRVACHVACAAVFLVAVVGDLIHGWRPTGDDAIIAARASSVFSLHPPLVGQFSQGSGGPGHTFYDLGPLVFWLLAAPVRLDPTHGVLWGSALLCLVGAGIAVEAARVFRGDAGGVVVVLMFAIIASTQSFVVVNPVWNPSVGVVWFITTVAAAAAVASGRLTWFPILVVAASVAAQSHFEFAAAAFGLVVVGLAFGFARRSGFEQVRWVAVGAGIGALCWLPTLIQQVTSRTGNLTVAWDWLSRRPTMGTTFGLQALTSAAGPQPLWLSPQNRGSDVDAFLGLLAHFARGSGTFGIVVLGGLLVIAVAAWRWRSRDLAILAVLTLIVAVITVWTMSALPQSSILTIVYADVILWPVGMMVWIVALWAAAAFTVGVGRRARRTGLGLWAPGDLRLGSIDAAGGPVSARWDHNRRSRSRWPMAIGTLALGALGASVAVSTVADPHLGVPGGWAAVDRVSGAAAAVGRVAPRGAIALYVDSSNSDTAYSLAYGVIWQLRQEGRDATATDPHWQPLGPNAAPSSTAARLTLRIGHGASVTVTPDPRQ